MRALCVPLAVMLLGCAACGSNSPQPNGEPENSVERAEPDQPLQAPFPGASEVRLLVNTDYDKSRKPIFRKPEGVVLSESQRKEFESLIHIDTISAGEGVSLCFIPHHFFRYFDTSGKEVGEIAVCFCCAGVEASGGSGIRLGEYQRLNADWKNLELFLRSLGEQTDVQCEDEGKSE